MTKFDWKYIPIFVLLALSLALAPVFHAQDQSVTRVIPVPDGVEYMVDGQEYLHASSAVWPAGSKHVLSAHDITHVAFRTRYTFSGWSIDGGQLPFNPVTVTATPSISEYRAVFSVAYALGVVFFDCPEPARCESPGRISIEGAPYNSTAEVYLPANSTVVLQAFPNPGYVFAGWRPGANQVIQGFQNTVNLPGPQNVYPVFQPARKVTLATDPAGLSLLADRALATAPAIFDWGVDTVHTVGANSPQRDKYGKWWAFESWSDGGEINHAYTVANTSTPIGLTAKYVPAAGVRILTQPLGLKIKVDGQYNVLDPYHFAWGAGEKHRLEAALQQTDADGRVWKFQSWSNGGTATQDLTVPAEAGSDGMVLTATYTALTKLTVNSSLGALAVKVDGAACTTPCEMLRDPGTQVKVSAPATILQGEGSRADFDGWIGVTAGVTPGSTGELVMTVGENPATVNANYHQLNKLTAASEPLNGAVWTVLPASADGFYRSNASVALSLAAQPGYKFRRWDGDLSGTIPSGVVTMSAPRMVKALFDPVPYIAPAGVMNAAGTTPQAAVAPGGIISIFGVNLTAETIVAPEGMLPQTLGGLTVRVAGRLLPLFFVSPGQINAQIPDDLAPGDQVLSITPAGLPDVRAPFKVVRNAPGLFAVAGGQAMAIHEDGSPVTADAPARAGELLTVYGTGFGPAERSRPEGFPIPQATSYAMVDGVTVQVGEASIAAEKAFAVAGRCGIDAVQFRLAGAITGTVTLRLSINGADSNTLVLPVQ